MDIQKSATFSIFGYQYSALFMGIKKSNYGYPKMETHNYFDIIKYIIGYAKMNYGYPKLNYGYSKMNQGYPKIGNKE